MAPFDTVTPALPAPCEGDPPPAGDPPALVLFRDTPADAGAYGAPFRATGIRLWAFTLFLATIAVAMGLFLVLGRYARKETVIGTLEPTVGTAPVIAPRPGSIQSVLVSEGRSVAAGEPIVTIASTSAIGQGQPLSAALEDAGDAQRRSLAAQRTAALAGLDRQADEIRTRQSALRSRLELLGQEQALWMSRKTLDEESLAALSTLRAQGYASEFRLKEQQKQVIAAEQAITALLREQGETRSAIDETGLQLGRIAAERDQLKAENAFSGAQLDERQATQRAENQTVLTAPVAGTIAALRVRPGSAAEVGVTVATILPHEARLEARLWAPSRAVGFLQVGDHVRLLYDAFPFQRFGAGEGRIIAVARAPTAPDDLPVGLKAEEPMYLVRVTLGRQTVQAYGKEWPLSPGGRISADLVLESQSFLDWLLDPFRAVQRRSAG